MSIDGAERLREARKRAGFSSAQEAAEAFGWGVGGYRHHENGTRRIGIDAATKYGRAFKIKPGWLLGMPGVDDSPLIEPVNTSSLEVIGNVAAGVWREPSEDFPLFTIDSPAPAGGPRVGFVLEGYSMDLCYEPGTVLDCISIFGTGLAPQDGDHVIVERVRPDGLRELTVKEFLHRDGENYLLPRSTKPEFQREIAIGSPCPDHPDYGGEVRIIAYVVSAIPPRALRLLERLGKIRR